MKCVPFSLLPPDAKKHLHRKFASNPFCTPLLGGGGKLSLKKSVCNTRLEGRNIIHYSPIALSSINQAIPVLTLSYYINKFKPPEIIQAAAETEVSSPLEPVQPESSPEVVSEVKVEPEVLKEASNENTVSWDD
ncbi:hypothetical protein PIB30_021093 [Stylosanthes scabra]|uniref:Uncharacterized protein n=1 Tax=Stylosanthes scabra TaxID=79078 RepID=A0ABU6Y6Z5_9FABA|nr:hypothetical protein [Stylosanthes scabra]